MSDANTSGIGSLGPVQGISNPLPGGTPSSPVHQSRFKPGDVVVNISTDVVTIKYIERVSIDQLFGDIYHVIELESDRYVGGFQHNIDSSYIDAFYFKWEDAIATSAYDELKAWNKGNPFPDSFFHTHTWKHYQGLTQQYEYCEVCDVKR